MFEKEKTEKDCEYRTYQFRIKKSNPLFNYCDEMCFNSKNLYNIGNFYIRQAFSGLKKEEALRHENEITVINNINNNIGALNKIKTTTFEKRKHYKNNEEKTEPKLLKTLDENNSFVSSSLLDSLFRLINQVDYRNLPAQTNDHTLKLLGQDWKSFFNALKEYKINPSKFKDKPKIPRYAKKYGKKVATFTNQSCKLKTEDDKTFLIFPKTNLTLQIGKIGLKDNNLREVRIVPNSNFYTVEMITIIPKSVVNEDSNRIIAIDLGVNNFATISNNVGLTPIIIKGGILKAKNQFYNKLRAHYYGILRMGKNTTEGQFTSSRLNKLGHEVNSVLFKEKSSTLVLKDSHWALCLKICIANFKLFIHVFFNSNCNCNSSSNHWVITHSD